MPPIIVKRFRCLFSFLCCLVAIDLFAAEPLDKEKLMQDAERCRAILDKSLVQFYLPAALDKENGGYKEFLKGNTLSLGGEKFLTLQARHVWFFSALAQEGIRKEESLAAARHGYLFLQEKFLDKTNGGYYSKVTDKGEPKDNRKHAYLNAFTLYALSAYHKASGDLDVLNAANDLFQVLEAKAYDTTYGGYIEFFSVDWKPITDPNTQGYVGAISHKTYNTHLHLLEAFAEFLRIQENPLVRQRLMELIAINVSTVHSPIVNNNVDAFHRDWRMVMEPRNLRASYGHDVECVWLVMDAAEAAGLSKATLRNWAMSLGEACLQFGYDQQHGGFYSGGELGKPADDLKKIWWVQAEALVGMLELYRQTGESKYMEAFQKTLDFVEQHQVASEGSWWATRAADGSATPDRQRSSPWHGAYHGARSMILSAKWLEQLAKQPKP
ncbi:MAG: AGE family epimerase/isomerase [Verrucomicrobiales bacterium]